MTKMNIREYFENRYNNAKSGTEFDKVWEEEVEVYEMDDDVFQMWADINNIDLEATKTVAGEQISVVTLWAWDIEE